MKTTTCACRLHAVDSQSPPAPRTAALISTCLDKLAARASEKQEVTIGPETARGRSGPALVAPGPKAEAAKQVISELKGIYVRSYEFDDDKAYSMDDINTHSQAVDRRRAGSKLCRTSKRAKADDWELQEVYFFQQGGKINGIFLINAEPGELQRRQHRRPDRLRQACRARRNSGNPADSGIRSRRHQRRRPRRHLRGGNSRTRMFRRLAALR